MPEKLTLEGPEATDEKNKEPITSTSEEDDNTNVKVGEVSGIHQGKEKMDENDDVFEKVEEKITDKVTDEESKDGKKSEGKNKEDDADANNEDDKKSKNKKGRKKEWPCSVCDINIERNDYSIPCKACGNYVHLQRCAGYKDYREGNEKGQFFRCSTCVRKRVSIPIDKPKRGPGRPRLNTVPRFLMFKDIPRVNRKRKTTEKEELPVKVSPVKKKNKNDEDEETSAINDLEKQTETETKSNTNTKTNDKTTATEKKQQLIIQPKTKIK